MTYIGKVLVGFDQLLNAIFNGMPDETMSSSLYRNRNKGKRWKVGYNLVNTLFFWQTDHCHEAWESEAKHKHLGKDFKEL